MVMESLRDLRIKPNEASGADARNVADVWTDTFVLYDCESLRYDAFSVKETTPTGACNTDRGLTDTEGATSMSAYVHYRTLPSILPQTEQLCQSKIASQAVRS